MSLKSQYKFLKQFSHQSGIPEENLIAAFEIEKEFHEKVLKEKNPEARKKLYQDVYETVHSIYNKNHLLSKQIKNTKDNTVKLLRKELQGKSIIDIGCGNGDFLRSVAQFLSYKKLVGIDTSSTVLPKEFENKIKFIQSDIIDFNLDEKFDIVFSDNVFEHIAPSDVETHIRSLKRILNSDGKLIIITPNRLFGPSDVTRIVDYTYTNRIQAVGTHLNELTYNEIISLLGKFGFKKFHATVPFPRLRLFLSFIRIPAKILLFVERVPLFIRILHSIKYKSVCIARLDIILICSE